MNSAEVTLPCPACGTAVVPGAPFCGACGSSVSPTARAAAAATARAAAEARAAAGAHAVVLVPATPSRRVLALLVDHLASACVLVTAYVVLVAGSGTAIASASDGAALAAMAGALLLPAVLTQNAIPIGDRDSSIPKPVGRVIDRALAMQPKDRYADGGELKRALGKALG